MHRSLYIAFVLLAGMLVPPPLAQADQHVWTYAGMDTATEAAAPIPEPETERCSPPAAASAKSSAVRQQLQQIRSVVAVPATQTLVRVRSMPSAHVPSPPAIPDISPRAPPAVLR